MQERQEKQEVKVLYLQLKLNKKQPRLIWTVPERG